MRRRAARVALPKTNALPDAPALNWRRISASEVVLRGDSFLQKCFAQRPYELLDGPSVALRLPPASAPANAVVLALGAGAARAAAHVGVLRQIEHRGIKIDGVTASGGAAMIAAMHAIGMDEQETASLPSRSTPTGGSITPSRYVRMLQRTIGSGLLFELQRRSCASSMDSRLFRAVSA
jgi:hypothetical protein